ncbi:MAG: ABC transporter permease [Vicinamibacteria bacterium]|jgi:putative ABC transport system permease protein|nr:ABC transporter permease [Vicinamibacteria bacterium]
MRVLDSASYAAAALCGHRLRTILSVVGLAIGIAAVVALTGLGEGARRYVIREFSALGSNLLIILPGKVETSGGMPFGGVPHDLTLDDCRAILTRIGRVKELAPVSMGTETIHFAGRRRAVPIVGTTASFLRVRHLVVNTGRFLATNDLDRGDTEVVLGATVARELFGAQSPLGEVVRIGDWRFRVVGVMAPKGRSVGFDVDDIVFVPVQTGMTMLNRNTLFRVLIDVRDYSELDSVREELLRLLSERHRSDDITIISQDAMLASFSAIIGVLTLTLVAIASVSLGVAGVGIMNVMLVSVTERRAEIGLLKALGATPGEIVRVFLIEALLISTIGGVLGLLIGWVALLLVMQSYPSFPAAPPWWAVFAAIALALLVGVTFGVWPARRAMRLDPVAALSRS